MRRLVIVLLLVASHAGVLWLGWHGEAAGGSAASSTLPTKPESRPAADRDQESPGVRELLRKAEARSKKEEDDYSDEAMAKRAAEIAAAKKRIPEDADLEARVRAGTAEREEVSVETVAAFGLWIDRDPLAALRWFGAWDPDYATSDFDVELKRHLQEGGLAMLDHYLKELPLCRSCLFYEIDAMADDRGPGFAVDLAAGLSDPEDRLEMLTSVLDESAELKGNLARIRSALPDREANEFLKQVGNNGNYSELTEELHGAGFPAAALARLDEQYAADGEPEQEAAAEEKEKTATSLVEQIRAQVAKGDPGSINYNADFEQAVPDFDEWCTELGDGRLQPQEMMARLQAAIPGSESMEAQLRMIVLDKTFDTNPRQGLEWLRSAGGDWKESLSYLVGSSGSATPPELLESVVRDAYAGEAIPTPVEEQLIWHYRNWAQEDPEGVQEALAKMSDEAFRQKVEAEIKESQEEEEDNDR